MPSKKRNNTKHKKSRSTKRSYNHQVFWPLLFLTFILWLVYRSIFSFSVFFDELLGKAIFFAFPVLVYVSVTGMREIMDSFSFKKMRSGLLLGLAVGGIFGFLGAILGLLAKGGVVAPIDFYLADWFWWEMFLAILTSFWETLFFFSFVMLVIQDKLKDWPLLKQVSLVAAIFLLFHLPNLILRFNGAAIFLQSLLLFALAYGEALFFSRNKNAYALVLIQAIWGMVLLIHF